MKVKQYSQVFFDLDHTLWDFETNSRATLNDLYHELNLGEQSGADFNKFHATYHHYNEIYWDRFRKGHINREELRWRRMWRTLVEFKLTDEPLSKLMSERYLEILPTKTNLFPYCIEILDYLTQKGYPIHLITNGFEKTQHMKIRNSGIDHYFQEMITSEQAGIMKPHREIFTFAMTKADTTPERCIMIGDTLDADIIGARDAGIDTIYFNPAVPPRDGIIPTYIIDRLSGLRKLL